MASVKNLRKRLTQKQHQPVKFICFDCQHITWLCSHEIEQFYDEPFSQKTESPKLECHYCPFGICYPLNYTNRFGYTFTSDQKNHHSP